MNTAASSLNVGNVTNYSITSLAAGKSYFFYVSAVNTAGLESLPSASLIYSVPVSMPAAPSNLAGIAQSSTQVMLTWRDNSTNETGFQILRKTGASGSYLTNTVAANTLSFTNSGLVAGTQYFYKVRAYNSAGVSAFSSEISVTTPGSPPPATNSFPGAATFVQSDNVTIGNWKGLYGAKGGLAPFGVFALPTNCQINANYNYPFTWANPSTDPRALQKENGSQRFATCWQYETNGVMSFYLRFKDATTNRVSFYFVDFNNQGIQQKVEFFDYSSGKFLSGTTLSNFQNGVYLTWNLQGHVTMRITKVAGPSVMLSGIFFDANSGAEPVYMAGADTTSAGTWKEKYGVQGHSIASLTPSFPAYGFSTVSGGTTWTWAWSTTDPTALQRPSNSSRTATAWYAANTFDVKLNFTDRAYHRVSFYFVDFDNENRKQRVDLIDPNTGFVLDSTELSQFRNGVWLQYDIQGNVTVRVTRLEGSNAVLSGVFYDSPTTLL